MRSSLWRARGLAPFPEDCRGGEFGGRDPVRIDAEIAGMLAGTFPEGTASLDPSARRALERSRDEVRALLPHLRGESRRYFDRLRKLTDLTLAAREGPPADRPKRTQFWGADEEDDRLVVEILDGLKTATVCKADEYYEAMGDLDDGCMEVGDVVDVHDLRRRLRCRIRVTDVYVVRFGDIPDRLWKAEVCESADYFRKVHRDCWPDYDLTDDFEMIATHFELVEVL
ncbi:MAG: ASCH domain-containing protein [Gemmatimonadetes bacterium]|nr:ASCH domain-containing protein [Gemmatimonadota bacterium]